MHDIMKYAWFIKSSPPATHNTDVTVSDNGVLMCYLELNYDKVTYWAAMSE